MIIKTTERTPLKNPYNTMPSLSANKTTTSGVLFFNGNIPGSDSFQPSMVQNANQISLRESLERTKRTFEAASYYQSCYKQLGSIILPIHNARIADYLQPSYTPFNFLKLFNFCQDNGVFRLPLMSNEGIVKTSGATMAEDTSMGGSSWVSDTLYLQELLKDKNPAIWQKSLQTLSKFYTNERGAFERILSNPALYSQGDYAQGIAHIFNPNTMTRFQDWQINLRLESHASALKTFCDELLEQSQRVPSQMPRFVPRGADPLLVQTICNLAHYFQAIGYPYMRSCGPWEEVASSRGTTSDIDAVRTSYKSLYRLLFNPVAMNQPIIRDIRQQLQLQENQLNQRIGGKLQPLFQSPIPLLKLIQTGEQVVQQRLMSTIPIEDPDGRVLDAALLQVLKSDLPLGATVISDVKTHLNLLHLLSAALVRSNGMLRYGPYTTLLNNQNVAAFDTYLGPNSNLCAMPDGIFTADREKEAQRRTVGQYPFIQFQTIYPKGQLNNSEPGSFVRPEALLIKEQLGTRGQEAQWFMVSELSLAYGQQITKILQAVKQQNRMPTPEESSLIHDCLALETESLNRAYARITGIAKVKANGEHCPSFSVPEAYQTVSTMNKSYKQLPGVNTPLAWATASLYSASKLYFNNLLQLQTLTSNNYI